MKRVVPKQAAMILGLVAGLTGCEASAPPSPSAEPVAHASAEPSARPLPPAAAVPSATTSQTYADAMRIACDAPAHVEPGAPFTQSALARYIVTHVANQEVRSGFASIAASPPAEGDAMFDAMLARAEIPSARCALHAARSSRAASDPRHDDAGPDPAPSAAPPTGQGFGIGHGKRRPTKP